MGDLSNWDNAKVFSGVEVSALILGLDPIAPDFDPIRVSPVFRELDAACQSTYTIFSGILGSKVILDEEDPEDALQTFYLGFKTLKFLIEPFAIWAVFALGSSTDRLEKLYKDDSRDLKDSSIQQFRREEVARWIRDNSIKSVYSFDLDAPAQAQQVTTAPTTPDTAPETIAQRNARWLAWYDEEKSRFDERGAINRVVEREKARNPDAPSRSTISRAIQKERDRIANEKTGKNVMDSWHRRRK